MSLRARMGLAAGVAVAIAVIAVAFSAYAGTRAQLTGQVDNSLQNLTRQILVPPGQRGAGPGDDRQPPVIGSGFGFRGNGSGGVREGPGVGDEGLGIDQRTGPAFGGAAGILTLFYASGGRYVPRGQSNSIPFDSKIEQIAKSGKGRLFTELDIENTDLRVLATGIGRQGALAVALPLTDVNHALNSELLLVGLIAAGGIALAALLAVLVARTAVAPIQRFTRQTEAIAASPETAIEHQRLEVTGKDELSRLARTFNTTLDALEGSIRAQRNLVADASHELRTPIATIRANLQLMRDEELLSDEDREALRSDVIEELDELTALVSDVVELARGTKQSGEPGDVRLDSVVEEALDRARRRAPGLRFEASLEPTLVRGEGDRIARAVMNLLDNASKWSPSDGGLVEVALRDGVLTVRDHGPGFHEEDLPFVFDRFHRAKDARSKPGSGLGLAIVRQAADAHGGWVQAGNAPDGGAVLTISFGDASPVADAEPRAVEA